MKKSKRYSFTKENLKKIGKGLLIAMAGAALTYIGNQIAPDLIKNPETALYGAILAALVNAGKEFIANR